MDRLAFNAASSVNEQRLARQVLAHEIAHVTQRHIARQIGLQKQMQVPMMAAMVAAILLGRSRPDLAQGSALAERDAGRARAVQHDALGHRLGLDAQVGALHGRAQIADGCRAAAAVARRHLVVAEPVLVTAVGDVIFLVACLNPRLDEGVDRKSTRLNSSHSQQSRMPSSA